MKIRLATSRDVPALMGLGAKYYVGNLDETERAHGFISVLLSREWFDVAVDSDRVHVAVDAHGSVVGFIAVTDPPEETSSPLVAAMLKLAERPDHRAAAVRD